MVTKREDGGAAFPETHVLSAGPDNPGWMGCSGMTLRDYFAGKAMAGMMARIGAHDAHVIAHDAYIVADAMLAERSK